MKSNMIKQIEIDFPQFGTAWLKLTQEFKEWINIIEQDNWYWKTVILNTIMSAFTSKFPWLRTLPEWVATITTDKDRFVLTKKCWIGNPITPNDLYQYCMPWKIFELKTTWDQRKVLVDLLWLDYDKFIKDLCDKSWDDYLKNYTDDIESELKKKMTSFITNEESIIADITRLKSELINFETKTFEDIDRYNSDKKVLEEKIREHNKWIIDMQNKYNALLRKQSDLNNSITNSRTSIETKTNTIVSIAKQLDQLRNEYVSTDAKAVCDKCWSELQWDNKQKVLDWLSQLAATLKQNIVTLQNEINWLTVSKDLSIKELDTVNKEVDSFNTDFNVLTYEDSNAPKVWMIIVQVSEARLKEYNDYNNSIQQKSIVERELKLKEDALKQIDTLKLQKSIDLLASFKKQFTNKLEEETKSLPVKIELFETLKNWNIKESFSIKYKGQDYYDLSTWNKMLVNLMLAKIFIDKLWLNFMLCDEASSISKSNLDYIKELSKTYQVIVAKATGWNNKDLI